MDDELIFSPLDQLLDVVPFVRGFVRASTSTVTPFDFDPNPGGGSAVSSGIEVGWGRPYLLNELRRPFGGEGLHTRRHPIVMCSTEAGPGSPPFPLVAMYGRRAGSPHLPAGGWPWVDSDGTKYIVNAALDVSGSEMTLTVRFVYADHVFDLLGGPARSEPYIDWVEQIPFDFDDGVVPNGQTENISGYMRDQHPSSGAGILDLSDDGRVCLLGLGDEYIAVAVAIDIGSRSYKVHDTRASITTTTTREEHTLDAGIFIDGSHSRTEDRSSDDEVITTTIEDTWRPEPTGSTGPLAQEDMHTEETWCISAKLAGDLDIETATGRMNVTAHAHNFIPRLEGSGEMYFLSSWYIYKEPEENYPGQGPVYSDPVTITPPTTTGGPLNAGYTIENLVEFEGSVSVTGWEDTWSQDVSGEIRSSYDFDFFFPGDDKGILTGTMTTSTSYQGTVVGVDLDTSGETRSDTVSGYGYGSKIVPDDALRGFIIGPDAAKATLVSSSPGMLTVRGVLDGINPDYYETTNFTCTTGVSSVDRLVAVTTSISDMTLQPMYRASIGINLDNSARVSGSDRRTVSTALLTGETNETVLGDGDEPQATLQVLDPRGRKLDPVVEVRTPGASADPIGYTGYVHQCELDPTTPGCEGYDGSLVWGFTEEVPE